MRRRNVTVVTVAGTKRNPPFAGIPIASDDDRLVGGPREDEAALIHF